MLDRRSFLALGSVPVASALSQTRPQASSAAQPASFLTDPDFGFTAQLVLGAAYYRGSDPGKLLAIVSQIKPGDFESAFQAYHDAGVDARKLADQAAGKHHNVSAREAYFWAAGYFSAAMRMIDGTADPNRAFPCWKEYAACWSAAAALLEPPAERLEIPYEGVHLTAWFLRADGVRRRRPLVILNNGADGLDHRMYQLGGAGALARGCNCLILNGPGQGDSLWVRKLYFRHDWEKVITPVVDVMVRHPEVDPKRIVLLGVSQGGFWAPRALAFEHRIAAGVADPGVFDIPDMVFRNLPQVMRDMLHDGKKSDFDQIIGGAIIKDPKAQMTMRFRMRPYGTESYFDFFRAVERFTLADVAGQITCPMLVTDPEDEQFFPGQSQKLYDALRCPKTLARFTRQQGAEQHCEANALGFRDFCIYNWLDETLA